MCKMHSWLNEEGSEPVSKDLAKTETKSGANWVEYFFKEIREKSICAWGFCRLHRGYGSNNLLLWVIGASRSARISSEIEGMSTLSKKFPIALSFAVVSEEYDLE